MRFRCLIFGVVLGVVSTDAMADSAVGKYDPCNLPLEEFNSVSLPENAPSSLRDEKGKWLNDTRGLEAACGQKPPQALGQRIAISVSVFCPTKQMEIVKWIIPDARLAWIDGEHFSTVAVEISREDYDWLYRQGLYDHENRGVGATFYADCEDVYKKRTLIE